MKSEYQLEVEEILADPTRSYWLKAAIKALENRDPLDAAGDAEKLHQLQQMRWQDIQTKASQ